MPTPSPLHSTASLHHTLFQLRILAEAARLMELLHLIDDAIDAVVRTSELEQRWAEHPVHLGFALAQPDRLGLGRSGLPTSLPLIEDARQHHQDAVLRVKSAIVEHAESAYFRRVLGPSPSTSPPCARPQLHATPRRL